MQRQDFHCLIAVKRRGPVNIGPRDDERSRAYEEEFVEEANHRAFQIASVVALTLISESRKWETCGLVSQVSHQDNSVATLAFETGGAMFRGSGRGSRTRLAGPLRVSRAELEARIRRSPARAISAVLVPQTSPATRSLARAVSAAAIRLADALHAHSPAAQLLGAVTAIEILVSSQGDSYETSRKRIHALLGGPACEQLEARRVLQERHRYVHGGKEPSARGISLKASALALACLIQFSELTVHFKSKSGLITYLDLLHAGGAMTPHWSEVDQASFDKLRKHDPFAVTFPYFMGLNTPERAP